MKIYFIILLLTPLAYSQWETGASYKIKTDIPENGLGIHISRNLPYQGATFGIKLRAEVNLFRQTELVSNSSGNTEQKFLSEDYNVHLLGEYYLRYFTPFFGFGVAYGELNSGQESWRGIILSLHIGNKFPVSEIINLYIEIQGYNYFAEFDPGLWGKDISTFQVRGVAGINISINTLSN